MVLETSDGVIFRVARTAEAAAGHSRESRLLPALGPALPVAVPAPEWLVEPGPDALPFGAVGYRKLPGTPLSADLLRRRNLLAADLAAFLTSLHRFPVDEAERAGVPRAATWSETLAGLGADVLPTLRGLVTGGELRLLERWMREVGADRRLEQYCPTLCHRDLWFENLLVDGDPLRLVGVLDWEAARIGDPAQDLDVHRYLGEPFATCVLSAYGSAEPGLGRRIQRFWEVREFAGLRWAIVNEDAAELEDSLAKLRAGPILGARDAGTL